MPPICAKTRCRGSAAAVPAFTAALANPQYKARGAVVAILAQRGRASKEIIPTLARALNNEDPAARKQAGGSLGAMGPRALPTLLAVAKGAVPRAARPRSSGLVCKNFPLPEEARKALVTALQDEDAAVQIGRRHAMGSVGNAKAKGWVPALVALVQNGESRDARFVPWGGSARPPRTPSLRWWPCCEAATTPTARHRRRRWCGSAGRPPPP